LRIASLAQKERSVDASFLHRMESLDPKLATLRAMQPVTVTTLPRLMPSCGVYLFSDGDEHLYVGRTNSLKKRLQNHCRPASTHLTAALAFRLARKTTGNFRATYKTQGSRAALLLDPNFAQAFEGAKAQLRQLEVRYVEEVDPIQQCLLEIYIAEVLKTKHNDFDNH
jgi:hypothetical protein